MFPSLPDGEIGASTELLRDGTPVSTMGKLQQCVITAVVVAPFSSHDRAGALKLLTPPVGVLTFSLFVVAYDEAPVLRSRAQSHRGSRPVFSALAQTDMVSAVDEGRSGKPSRLCQ
ncbi:hypothetical protein G6M50_12335 [Agrobacterium rhizogenes]|nr:hypothetical protein [Rhizobium rhizogenes]NTJ78570.1 hypothetical protein [Rhizobium rhizogenes]